MPTEKEFQEMANLLMEEHKEVFERLAVAGLSEELRYNVMSRWRTFFQEHFLDTDALTEESMKAALLADKGFLRYQNDEVRLQEIGVQHAGTYILYRLLNRFRNV